MLLLAMAKEPKATKEEVLEQLGCYKPSTKGSGTGTVAAGQYFFLTYYEKPKKGIIEAVNSLGTDTDTIGKFCGNLLGCLWGKEAYENELTEKLQDRYYLLRCASQLTGREEPDIVANDGEETDISQPQKEGNEYFSRVFGSGIITQFVKPRSVHRGSSTLHQARVQFFNGITCVFSKIFPRGNGGYTKRSHRSLW